ncbi:MAG: hypothetical protein ACYC1Y_01425 [Minisyncoccota bacterium]
MTNNTMTDQSNIERIVMRRVRRVRMLRALLSNAMLATLVFALALWGIGREVWVARVLENSPHDIASLPQFYLAAFDHTRFIVQALSLVTLAALITLARETARLISTIVLRRTYGAN